ncbi:MAG: lipocalin family protein [Bdellovibrionaceae bacterium]|nr:lipocalin family protein [Pseudobdellovibrionaceae bacterium]NUM57324.1 lipocalin family protein [Pseudobdellovibrionaceae bacterium]
MNFLLSFYLCIFTLGCVSLAKDSRPTVQTAQFVDLNKYLGKWYEVASIPQSFQKQCVANTTAQYSLTDNGLIKVLNSCTKIDDSVSVAEARARVIDTQSYSKLKVTFVKLFDWVFAFGGNYWILDVDSNYNIALVGDPTRNYAWILSRYPSLSTAQWVEAEKTFKNQGYDTCKILTSIQAGGLNSRVPLCQYLKHLSFN